MEIAYFTEVTYPDWSNKSVLLVEDDQTSSYLISEILKPTRIRLEKAMTGNSAVELCHNRKFDLVLMDIKLPDFNGLEATRIICHECPGTPIIAQTAYTAYDTRKNCFEAGCVEYLTKPLRIHFLINAMNKYLK